MPSTQTMAINLTVCGINLDKFLYGPAPDELAAIVAHWDSDQQAEFLSSLGACLSDCCGGRRARQWQYITDSLETLEAKLCDHHGSELISELASRLRLEG